MAKNIIEDAFGWIGDPEQETPKQVRRFTLKGSKGMMVQVINYGARVTSIRVRDMYHRLGEVLLGFDNIQGYVQNQALYFGAVLGRVANKVIEERFKNYNFEYEFDPGSYWEQRAGGSHPFDQAMWDANVVDGSVIFTLLSEPIHYNYPGHVIIQATYNLSEDNCLKLTITAKTTATTPVSLCCRLPFNLAGQESGVEGLLQHKLMVNADKFLERNKSSVPSGYMTNVNCTYYDLQAPRFLKEMIPLEPDGGYNHTYCVPADPEGSVMFVARLTHPPSGRIMEVHSDMPYIHVDVTRWLPPSPQSLSLLSDVQEEEVKKNDNEEKNVEGATNGETEQEEESELEESPHNTEIEPQEIIRVKGRGVTYNRYSAIILEPRYYPQIQNAMRLPSPLLEPGQTYVHTVTYTFSCRRQTNKISMKKKIKLNKELTSREAVVDEMHDTGALPSKEMSHESWTEIVKK